ncbi:MAG: phosphatidylglycerophosphatase A [Desulfobacteraceae bacterium]|nr:MAG: phosphatidylglycerophosphatase A [Desulfobacteraceae bacterium]
MSFTDKCVIFLATGFYSGKAPFVPGTFGTVVGLIFCFFLSKVGTAMIIPCLLLVIFLSILIAHKAESLLGSKDPGEIVIDEITGILITMAGLPFTTVNVIAGFILFRVLDIVKPFPIRFLEQKIPGGAGIVMDDVAAGIMAGILLRISLYCLS